MAFATFTSPSIPDPASITDPLTGPVAPSAQSLLAELDVALGSLRCVVRSIDPKSLSGEQATTAAERFAQIERLAASGLAIVVPVVAEEGPFEDEGHGSAAEWLGSVSGSSRSAAKGRLLAAERAAADPTLARALHDGALSVDQLKVVAKSWAAVPSSAAPLLEVIAGGGSHDELRAAALRLRSAPEISDTENSDTENGAAESPVAKDPDRDRIDIERYFSWRREETGGIRGGFFCDEVDFARVERRLEQAAVERWRAAGNGESSQSFEGSSLDAHRLDAFIELVGGSPEHPHETQHPHENAHPHETQHPHQTQIIVVIDAAALRAGTALDDELCEIVGIGPVSVAAAIELLSEGALRYVVKEGRHITAATESTRALARDIEQAFLAKYRTCAVPGCSKRISFDLTGLGIGTGSSPSGDHHQKHPDPEHLCPEHLCPEHLALAIYGGWHLEGGPGTWKWVSPSHPRHPSAGVPSDGRGNGRGDGRGDGRFSAGPVGNAPPETVPREPDRSILAENINRPSRT